MNLFSLLPSPWVEIAIAGGAAIASAGGFYAGSQHEHRTHIIREAKAVVRIEAARVKLQTAFDVVSGKLAADQQSQTQTFTEIRNVAGPIIFRTTSICLRDDGVQLLDRAAAAANRDAAGEFAGVAATAATVPAQR